MSPRHRARSNVLRRVIIVLVVLAVLLGGLAAAGMVLWAQYGDRVSQALGWTTNDYEGEGHGEVLITIRSGDIGSDVAATLAVADVVKTSQAFYELLLSKPDVDFQVGTYQMKLQMSAQAALDALLDPANRLEYTVAVPEGFSAMQTLERAADVMGIPIEDFEAAVADPTVYGVPAEFPSIEGYLFPATYIFEPGDTAETIVQTMVDRMKQALKEHGVAHDDEWRVLTLASIVQREAGSDHADFGKVARVFTNRLDIGMLLQSDATVTYGTGNYHTVWTSAAERDDESNPYNTYANPGLPIGPIGAPGDIAIEAALNPPAGDWLYFVTVNLETGETVFSDTLEQHEAAVMQLDAWCVAHGEAGGTRCDA